MLLLGGNPVCSVRAMVALASVLNATSTAQVSLVTVTEMSYVLAAIEKLLQNLERVHPDRKQLI